MNKSKLVLTLTAVLIYCKVTYAENLSLNIFVNTDQCVNCNIALSAIEHMPASVIKNLYFPIANKAVAEEVVESYPEVKNLNIRYFDKKNSPFKTVSNLSYCVLYDGKHRIDSFELKVLYEKLKGINALVKAEVKTLQLKNKIAIPDSIKFSDRLRVFAGKNHMSICDYLLNKNVTLSFNPAFTKLNSVLQIKGSAFKPYPFLKSGIVDTTLYRMRYADLKFLKKTKPEINASYLSDSALYLFITFPCPITVKQDTGIGGTFFMYRKNLFTLKSELFAIPEDMLPPVLSEEYFIANIDAFYVKKNRFYFTLYQDNLKKENYFLAEYERVANRVLYKTLANYKISDSIYLNTDSGMGSINSPVFISSANSSFYFAAYQPIIINTNTGVLYNFANVLGKNYSHSLAMRDVAQLDADNIMILASRNKVEKCLVYNTKNNSLVSENEIKIPANINIESLKFIHANKVMALDNQNKHILFFGLD